MNDLKLLILHDPVDAPAAMKLKSDIDQEILGRKIEIDAVDRPTIELQASFRNLPDPSMWGALSLIVVFLPGRAFDAEEVEEFRVFRRKSHPENRLVPVASVPERNRPPEPLDDIKSIPLHSGGVAMLTTLLLNLLCLRLAGERRRVFISYKTSDGVSWAEKVAKGLRERGYDAWRDDDADPRRDNMPMLTLGEPAQLTIQDAIVRQGFVLVIDTMEAPLSGWVHEEVKTAIRHGLPVLPVVIEDAIQPKDNRLIQIPKHGGRFRALRDLDLEVRVPVPQPGMKQDLDSAFFDRLEAAMNATLLGQLRDRRLLIAETREKFRRRKFTWSDVNPAQLVYRVSLSRNSPLTPGLGLVLLVHCAPYGTVLTESVKGACDQFQSQKSPHQYVALIHRTNGLNPIEKQALLDGRGSHVMLLHTDEIDQLPSVFAF